jgi:hypothetical protein
VKWCRYGMQPTIPSLMSLDGGGACCGNMFWNFQYNASQRNESIVGQFSPFPFLQSIYPPSC